MKLYKVYLLFPSLFLLLLALSSGDFKELSVGLLTIMKHPGILITDYFAIAGIPATLLNVALVGLIGWGFCLGAPAITGNHIAALLTLMGFAFFGKNLFNILPVFLGCFLFARASRKPFQEVLPASLFATSLAPVVGFLFCHWGFRLELALISGTLSGFLTLAIASRVASMHSGYNLYNVGFAGGIVGSLLAALLKGFGFAVESVLSWREQIPLEVPCVLSGALLFLVLLGFLADRQVFSRWKQLLSLPGKSPSDFFSCCSSATIWNMGVTGLLGVIYVLLVRGSFNGPVLGGIFTMVGFAAYGKHLRNVLPILAGVYLGTMCSSFKAHEPGPLLAALFSSALAPLAGEFGIVAGILAGFLHLFVAMNVGVLHGGLNLYNNGFAAGFVAVVVAGVFSYKRVTKTFEERLTG
ncbi:DUF1576 domain-containing protein [Candidatus Caldatribacterium sp.]|uniref:DUF1576 domain-containing protein n=1 Tax=Candidatus Caldatribacterium sp. TaxID=2282143 RepID=UPI003844FA30|nr:DUF1576 domain-containing protein [Candidatus Caldatribacterium sp.]